MTQEKAEINNFKNIVLLDFCSEKNRGDAAKQLGLIKLVFRYITDPIISIVSVFGVNQINQLINEHDHSCKYPVTILGGLKPTFYSFDNSCNKSIFLIELKNAVYFCINLVLLLLLVLKIPFAVIKKIFPKAYDNTLEQIRDADLVIWNGRNFRSRDNHILEIFRILNLVYHPLVCIFLSKPVACVGVSLWHLNNPLSRIIAKYTFHNSFFISVRDEFSYNEVKKLLGENCKAQIFLLPDLSFALYEEGKAIKEKREPISDSLVPKTIGFTIVDWKDDGEQTRNNYKKAISDVIEYFIHQGSKIVIIPQVTKKWEDNNLLVTEIIKSQHNENISIIEGTPTIVELLTIYSKIDFLVATRMHSAIFASIVGTPIVALPYDKGGKWSIIQELGLGDYILNQSDISTAVLIEKIQKCWESKKSVLVEVDNNIQLFSNKVDLNVKKLLEVFLLIYKQPNGR